MFFMYIYFHLRAAFYVVLFLAIRCTVRMFIFDAPYFATFRCACTQNQIFGFFSVYYNVQVDKLNEQQYKHKIMVEKKKFDPMITECGIYYVLNMNH